MQSAWSDEQARATVENLRARDPRCNEDIALRVYTSRLIGREPQLVLHGGGNTSVKTTWVDDLGEEVAVLCVKGSGWDLGSIEPRGLPAVRLASLTALRGLASLSDEAMVNATRTRLLDASSPTPSVETLLHAFLPHRFIDHSHADAILALVDQRDASALCREVFGDTLAVVPYVMPGFDLAKLAAEVYESNPDSEGLLLLQHGLFTYGDTARESYERHIRAVTKAEAFVASRRPPAAAIEVSDPGLSYRDFAPCLRGRLGAGQRRYVLTARGGRRVRGFVDRADLHSVARRGPATPDHVIRTKQRPLVLSAPASGSTWADQLESALARYREDYAAYFRTQVATVGQNKTMLDPDPRVILVPGFGLVAAGPNPCAAEIAADIYEHTIAVIEDAEAVGAYRPLDDTDLFAMEYWSLEQAKLGRKPAAPLAGQVVYVTGAASGIGAACARALVGAGAEVFLVDRDARSLRVVAEELHAAWHPVDVTDAVAVQHSFDLVVRRFGGVDGVVSNAGTAPRSPIADCSPQLMQSSLDLNLLAHQVVASEAVAILRAQGTGGFLTFNASKAAFNPGPGFGPYAIAKAGLIALMRQFALELGDAGIRSNAVNADRVRTGLFSDEFVVERARARGIDPARYFRANLLQQEVTADDVADAFVWLATAKRTTGAVITVDGGNIAAAPR
ncbi:MAG: bifunctional aldolase/short-chain dehydrogenase [Myxococcales bacterium FL481]|nr:MAG: bifunctional aldolase/short-chain dehydrogenase [Myxococcales bacterium FL481]